MSKIEETPRDPLPAKDYPEMQALAEAIDDLVPHGLLAENWFSVSAQVFKQKDGSFLIDQVRVKVIQ